jgi:biotin-(acetyl-CoA carboxylase) ligase
MKVGGIISSTAGSGVIIGIGINVSTTVTELPVETATSLALAGVTKLDRNSLFPLLLNAFERISHRGIRVKASSRSTPNYLQRRAKRSQLLDQLKTQSDRARSPLMSRVDFF